MGTDLAERAKKKTKNTELIKIIHPSYNYIASLIMYTVHKCMYIVQSDAH